MTNGLLTATSWTADRETREGLLSRQFRPPSECLNLQSGQVRTKKYLYVLRPVLACRWIEAGRGVVPMQFGTLYHAVAPREEAVRAAIEALMAQKKAGFETDRGPRIDVLNAFLSAEIAHFEALQLRAPKRPPVEEMDRFLRGAMERAWAAH